MLNTVIHWTMCKVKNLEIFKQVKKKQLQTYYEREQLKDQVKNAVIQAIEPLWEQKVRKLIECPFSNSCQNDLNF